MLACESLVYLRLDKKLVYSLGVIDCGIFRREFTREEFDWCEFTSAGEFTSGNFPSTYRNALNKWPFF